MKNLSISQAVLEKLKTKHSVERADIRQCFLNRKGKLLQDVRALTKTNPPTLWFLAKTNRDRILKVVYIQRDHIIHLKTAYEPNAEELAIYQKHGGPI